MRDSPTPYRPQADAFLIDSTNPGNGTPMSTTTPSGPLMVDYLNGPDVTALALTNDEILTAVWAGLAAQGRGETVIEPRMHLAPDASFNGHFNVLRGYIAPMALAGVKSVRHLAGHSPLGF